MRVAIFTPHTRWKPHWETELEIIQRHLDAGDSVVHWHCDGALMACDDNAEHRPSRCRECIAVRREGLRLLSSRIRSRPFLSLTQADRREMAALPKTFASVDELKQVRVEGFDLGWAVLSSVVSLTRHPTPDLRTLGNLPAKFVVAAYSVYRSIQHRLDRDPVDRVYAFNGRFAPCRAVLRACQSRNVPCFLHERGCDLRHYSLYENALPHDIAYFDRQVREAWAQAAQDPRRDAIADQFYAERAKGVAQAWYSFTSGQQAGLLPRDWDRTRRNIVIFSSSDDEFAAIGADWCLPFYTSQIDGVSRIAESMRAAGGRVHLYLRTHPNLRNIDNDSIRAFLALQSDVLTVIPPSDPVSSYTLVKEADTVVTFGSTVGIEATYWGKSSILAGTCFYRNLGATYNPASHDELIAMLQSDLPPRDRTPALMFGYYRRTFGVPFRYYTPTAVGDGTFKGRRIAARRSWWSIGWERIQDAWRYLQAVTYILYTRWRVMRRWRLG